MTVVTTLAKPPRVHRSIPETPVSTAVSETEPPPVPARAPPAPPSRPTPPSPSTANGGTLPRPLTMHETPSTPALQRAPTKSLPRPSSLAEPPKPWLKALPGMSSPEGLQPPAIPLKPLSRPASTYGQLPLTPLTSRTPPPPTAPTPLPRPETSSHYKKDQDVPPPPPPRPLPVPASSVSGSVSVTTDLAASRHGLVPKPRIPLRPVPIAETEEPMAVSPALLKPKLPSRPSPSLPLSPVVPASGLSPGPPPPPARTSAKRQEPTPPVSPTPSPRPALPARTAAKPVPPVPQAERPQPPPRPIVHEPTPSPMPASVQTPAPRSHLKPWEKERPAPIPSQRPVPVIPGSTTTQTSSATKLSSSSTTTTFSGAPALPDRPCLPPRKTVTTTTKTSSSTHTSSSYHSQSSSRINSHDAGFDDPVGRLSQSKAVTTSQFNGEHFDAQALDYTLEDHHARACPPSETVSIARLSNYLVSDFVDVVSKLRAIYTWVSHNIDYDYVGFQTGVRKDQSAEGVLRNRSCVCEGFSNIYLALATHARLPVSKISGDARGIGSEVGDGKVGGGHAWNVANIRGEWLLIDSTWASAVTPDKIGTGVKNFTGYYFLVPPQQMIYSHFPSDPKLQYLDPPVKKDVMVNLPCMKEFGWKYGMALQPSADRPRTHTIVADEYDVARIDIQVRKQFGPHGDQSVRLFANLMDVKIPGAGWNKNQQPVQALPIQRTHQDDHFSYFTIAVYCPSAGMGNVAIGGIDPDMIIQQGQELQYGMMVRIDNSRSRTSMGSKPPLITLYPPPQWGLYVAEPVFGQIPRHTRQTIRLEVYEYVKGKPLPDMRLVTPNQSGMPTQFKKVKSDENSTTFEMSVLLQFLGTYQVVFMKSGNSSSWSYSIVATFDAV